MANNWQPSSKKGNPQKRSIRSVIRMFLIISAMVLIIMLFFWGDSGFVQLYYLDNKIDLLERDIVKLKVQQSDLLWEKDKLENDPEYIQRFAVEKFGYAKPEQKIIQFVPGSDSTKSGEFRQISGSRNEAR